MTTPMKAIEVFYSYVEKDELFRDELEKHLSNLHRQGLITGWHSRNVLAGTDWAQTIDTHLNNASVILLLISPDFMASDYSYGVEVKRAIERYEAKEALVIPILLRPVDWEGALFDGLQALPSGNRFITSWPNLDEAFMSVAKGIRKSIKEWITTPSFTFSVPRKLISEETEKRLSQDTSSVGDYHINWEEDPRAKQLRGRKKELSELQRWLLDDRCKVVAILGAGGIGKTSLSVMLANQTQSDFTYVFGRSLRNAPPLKILLQDCIRFISNQQQTVLPEKAYDQITLLLQYLQKSRCLIVLDNVESILQAGYRTGQYREGYEEYGEIFRRFGEAEHQSCLLLTSREKPQEIALLDGKTSSVRSWQLEGMQPGDCRAIVRDKGLQGTKKHWETLINLYAGNPLALKLVSEFIREVYQCDIATFLQEGEVIFIGIRDVLEQQFDRLSFLEQEIMYWLAIEREAISLNSLRQDVEYSLQKGELQEALRSLKRRSQIEISTKASITGFTLQNVIMEYVTDRLIHHVCNEIETEEISLFGSHALVKAQAKNYVRESQMRLILHPIAQHLLSTMGKEGVEKQLRGMLSTLRQTPLHTANYAAGNILNLLIHLGCDLHGFDFSHLMVKQAYLQNATLSNVNFAYADLKSSVFSDTFGTILSVAFSPNGELLAAGTTTGEIRMWQVSSGTPLQTYQGHTDWVRALAFSPDSKLLASASSDHSVQLWEARSGHRLAILQGHSDWVMSVAFSPDGLLVASCGGDRTIRLWEVNTGRCLLILREHSSEVKSVAFSSDGSRLASGSEDTTIRLWEVSTGRCLRVLQGHSDEVKSVAFNYDGTKLASGSNDRTIRLWDSDSGQSLCVLAGHTHWVRSVAFSPDGSTIVSSSEDHSIRLWETSSGRCLQNLTGHTAVVWSVAFSPDGSTIASGGEDHSVRLWEVSSGHCTKTLQGYTNRVWCVVFDPVGNVLASGSEDQTIRLWDTSTGKNTLTLQGHTDLVRTISFGPDGNIIASGGEDQTIRLWRLDIGQCLYTLSGHTRGVMSTTFSPDGKILVSSSEDHSMRVWEVSSGRCLHTLIGNPSGVWSVAFSPDGKIIASGRSDKTVQLWEVNSGRCLLILQGHTNRVWSVAFNSNGSMVASGSADQTIRLWDINTGQCLHTLKGHTGQVRSVAFSPDGKTIASGGDDQAICVWNTNTGQCLHTLKGHTGQVRSVAFSPDNRMIASGSHDGTSRLWDLQTGKYLKTLRSSRQYEGMDITSTSGLTEAQKSTLKALGAFDRNSV